MAQECKHNWITLPILDAEDKRDYIIYCGRCGIKHEVSLIKVFRNIGEKVLTLKDRLKQMMHTGSVRI